MWIRFSQTAAHLQIIFFGREHCPAQRHDASACPICSWGVRSALRQKPLPMSHCPLRSRVRCSTCLSLPLLARMRREKQRRWFDGTGWRSITQGVELKDGPNKASAKRPSMAARLAAAGGSEAPAAALEAVAEGAEGAAAVPEGKKRKVAARKGKGGVEAVAVGATVSLKVEAGPAGAESAGAKTAPAAAAAAGAAKKKPAARSRVVKKEDAGGAAAAAEKPAEAAAPAGGRGGGTGGGRARRSASAAAAAK